MRRIKQKRKETQMLSVGKHAVVLHTSASFPPTFAAHGSHRLLQLCPLSVCVVADADVDPGLPVVGVALLCDQDGRVGNGQAGEASGQEHGSVFWQQGEHRVRAQDARLVLQTRRTKIETLWVRGLRETPLHSVIRAGAGRTALRAAGAKKREQRRSGGRVRIDYNRHVLQSARHPLEMVLNAPPHSGEPQHFLEFQPLVVRKDNKSQNNKDKRKEKKSARKQNWPEHLLCC